MRYIYRFDQPQPDERTRLRLTPLQLIERLAALIPPPRLHRHRYHGVLAPNAPLRAQVTALARQLPAPLPEAAPLPHSPERPPARYPGSGPGRALWALLLARIYEVLPPRCVAAAHQAYAQLHAKAAQQKKTRVAAAA
jgi:hypothetical protein